MSDMTMLYLLFVVALFVSTVSADVSWSIDCGASTTSVDSNFIPWTGDGTLISTGQPKSVSTTYLTSNTVINTLRAFPSGTKNCYVLKGEIGAKVQLRAIFYYGDYDGESAPPTFGLEFDGNAWASVKTTMDSNIYIFYDVIYVTKGDNINVCLIQTNPSQIPFISAIQVSTLKPAMYDFVDSGKALFLVSRRTLATGFIRYPTDAYDRLWAPMSVTAGSSYVRLTYDGSFIDTSNSPEEPPQDVLEHALTTSSMSATETLTWNISNLPGTPTSVYLKLYFSEMTDLAWTETRSFSVYIGGTLMESAIEPPYGEVSELTVSNILMSKITEISLVPETDSTESPLVNAMEVFQISDYIVSYTSATGSPSPPTPTSPTPPTPSSSSPPTTPTPTPPSSKSPSPPTPRSPPGSFSPGESLNGKEKSKLPLILGVGIPMFVALTAFLTVMFLLYRKRKLEVISGAGVPGVPGQFGPGVAMSEFPANNGGHDNYRPDRPYPPPPPIYSQQPQH